MEPIDKSGRPIYPKQFDILKRYGEALTRMNWREASSKPNLFFKSFMGVTVFADMRGTEIVPIWEDPCPMIFVVNGKPEWMRRRATIIADKELSGFKEYPIRFRYSFYDECEPEGLRFGDDGHQCVAKGFCNFCDKLLDNGSVFCSERCEKAYAQREKEELKARIGQSLNSFPFCEVCKKKIVPKDWLNSYERCLKEFGINVTYAVEHHLSYEENETIVICQSCHSKIHHSSDPQYDDLKPKDKRPAPKKKDKKEKVDNRISLDDYPTEPYIRRLGD